MRILMLSRGHFEPTPGAPEIGGSGRQCWKLSKALARQNVQVTIVTNRLSWRDPAKKIINGIPVIFLNTGRPLVYRRGLKRLDVYAFMLNALLYLFRHRKEYDIIHVHSALVPGFTGVLAARWLKKKSIVKVMNSGPCNDVLKFRNNKTIFGARFMANYLVNCDCVITLNELASRELTALGFHPEQIALIPNGVEAEEIETKPRTDTDTIRLIFVGRLDHSKNVDVLLEAFEMLTTKTARPCHLTILGRGSLKPQLQTMTDTLGIAHQVNFAGEVPNVMDYLCASDIFVLPSQAEGISNALLEAMACGLPCVATDIAGNQAVIEHRRNGLLVEARDKIALAKAIHTLTDEDELRHRLGQAARETVESQFSITTTARQYINLYQKLLESPT